VIPDEEPDWDTRGLQSALDVADQVIGTGTEQANLQAGTPFLKSAAAVPMYLR
jgi:hypothetical protein